MMSTSQLPWHTSLGTTVTLIPFAIHTFTSLLLASRLLLLNGSEPHHKGTIFIVNFISWLRSLTVTITTCLQLLSLGERSLRLPARILRWTGLGEVPEQPSRYYRPWSLKSFTDCHCVQHLRQDRKRENHKRMKCVGAKKLISWMYYIPTKSRFRKDPVPHLHNRKTQ